MLNRQNYKKTHITTRIISFIMVQLLLFQSFVWAGALDAFEQRKNRSFFQQQVVKKEIPRINIPLTLGYVKESYISKRNSRKIVIHIQDMHADYQAQLKIAKLIKYLKDKYGISFVGVEGGFGDFDGEFFRRFPEDKEERGKLARYFLKKGFLSAADYLLITEDNPPIVYGVEDKTRYFNHLNKFRTNQASAESVNNFLAEIEPLIRSLKTQFYSSALKKIDSQIENFRQKKLSLEEFLSYLDFISAIHAVDITKFPNLSALIQLQRIEGKIDFTAAEIQRQAFIDTLVKNLSQRETEELVKKSLDFKADKLKNTRYYAYLQKLARKISLDFSGGVDFSLYVKYIFLFEKLDNAKAFREIDEFLMFTKERICSSQIQRDIGRLSCIAGILRKLSGLTLSPQDYAYFKKNKKFFSRKNIQSLLRNCAGGRLIDNLPFNSDIFALEDFYKIARQREQALVDNFLQRLAREHDSEPAVLISGGFHTPGITSILREKDISYLVIAPSFEVVSNRRSVYFSLLKDKRLPLQELLNEPDALQLISSISDSQARTTLIHYWIYRASRDYPLKKLQEQLTGLKLSVSDEQIVQSVLKDFISHAPAKTVKREPSYKKNIFAKLFSRFFSQLHKKIILPVAFASIIMANIIFPSFGSAHYFKPAPTDENAVVAVMEKWTDGKENTLSGISEDINIAAVKARERYLSRSIYGKEGWVEEMKKTQGIRNPEKEVKEGQEIYIRGLSEKTANELVRMKPAPEDRPLKVTEGAGKIEVTESLAAVETDEKTKAKANGPWYKKYAFIAWSVMAIDGLYHAGEFALAGWFVKKGYGRRKKNNLLAQIKLRSELADLFAPELFTVDRKGKFALTKRADGAIKTLSGTHNELVLEIDVEALIDTQAGVPQLKAYGFKEAVTALFRHEENKKIYIRLINLGSKLKRERIITVLDAEDLIKDGVVSIPDIPAAFKLHTQGVEPYLKKDSIRVVSEANVQYFQKIDILVKRGREREVFSSLGLVVVCLAKDPQFFKGLPKDLKEYIIPLVGKDGRITLNEREKIKQLIFKPIERRKVDVEYVEQLDKINRELEGMV